MRKNKKGAGRPTIENKRNPITVMITKNEKQAIEALSKDLGKSFSSTMRYLLSSGFLFNMGYLRTNGGYIHAEFFGKNPDPPKNEYVFKRAWDYWGTEASFEEVNSDVDN